MDSTTSNISTGASPILLSKDDMKSDRVFQHLTRGRLNKFRLSSNRTRPTPPDHPDALHRSGIIAFQAGDFATALDLITRAIARHPHAPSYHNNLGLVLESAGKPAEALHAYRTALKLQPDYADACNNLGNVLRQQDRLDEAMTNFQAAIPRWSDGSIGTVQLKCTPIITLPA